MATENKQVSTWLRPDTVDAMTELARRDNRTVSMWIRLLIEERLTPKHNNGSASLLPDGVRDAEPKEASA